MAVNINIPKPIIDYNDLENKPTIPDVSGFVAKADYSPAHSVLVQQSGTGSPTSVQIGNNEFLGRKNGGGANIEGLSVSETKAILSYTTSDINDSSDKRYVTNAQLTVIGNTSGTNTGDETKASINSKLEEQDLKVTGNQSTTSLTAVTVNDLITGTLTAGKYAISGFIGASSTSTAGLRIGFNLPTDATLLIKGFESGATTTHFFNVANTLGSVSFIPRNGVGVISIEGTVTIGATSGTMQVIFAKTTSGTASILDEGTFLTVKKIA